MTTLDGFNEYISLQNMYISYGIYARDILRFYFGFSDEIILIILKLILA